ncbi:MAG: hypothetical protein FD181_3694 [Prolixibacteraceae bacterium]|nr:MAG: hypothetical protein FD181_3694 [Prolixibacteraceae bacterium]
MAIVAETDQPLVLLSKGKSNLKFKLFYYFNLSISTNLQPIVSHKNIYRKFFLNIFVFAEIVA